MRYRRSVRTCFAGMLSSAFLMAMTATLPSICIAASMELYGTFHAMGVIITLDSGEDPDEDAHAALTYRRGSEPYQDGFPLTRVSGTRFAGSIFWLKPGNAYDVEVSFSDPDGGSLDGTALTGTASTWVETSVPEPVDTFYVSPEGVGTACSLAEPCSLDTGISMAEAGDRVSLRGGVYYAGGISLPRSGSEGSPIVISGFPNESAILDGADPGAFSWTPQGGGVYQTSLNTAGPHLVTADGERLYPYQSLSDLQNLFWGIPGFYTTGLSLYVRLPDDADPAGASMAISRYNNAFLVEQDFIYFTGLTFRHYGQGSWAKAIYLNNAGDNLVQHCIFAMNDLGIGIKRASHRNVIQNNTFYDTTFLWPWDAVKSGSHLETGGVSFYSPATGRGNVIRRNTFHDYFDGFTCCPEDNGTETNETDVYENLVYHAGDDGLSADGACSNVRLWHNRFHDVLVGISLAPIYEGPIYAVRNLIYRTGAGNSSYSGYPFKFNSGYAKSGAMYLFHNTADAVLAENNGFYVKAPGSWELIYARNNIWAGTDYAIENYNTTWPIDLDYDNVWNDGIGDLVRWDGVHYATLAQFTDGTGQEPHGFSVDSDFRGAAGGDYSLADTSSLIDQGVPIPGINNHYVESNPDVGAFETGQRLMYVEPAGSCGGKSPCFSTIQEGIDAAPADVSTLLLIADDVYAGHVFMRECRVTLEGGWDAAFTIPPSGTRSVIEGTLAVTGGTLDVANMTIQP